jgi:transcriptional regulator with XRE-family HTH domain
MPKTKRAAPKIKRKPATKTKPEPVCGVVVHPQFNASAVGKNVKLLRALFGDTQVRFADRLRLTGGSRCINRYERGRMPDPSVLVRLAEVAANYSSRRDELGYWGDGYSCHARYFRDVLLVSLGADVRAFPWTYSSVAKLAVEVQQVQLTCREQVALIRKECEDKDLEIVKLRALLAHAQSANSETGG